MEEKDHTTEVREFFELKRAKERAWRLESENKELKRNNELLNTKLDSYVETQSNMLKNMQQVMSSSHAKNEDLESQVTKLKEELEKKKTEHETELATTVADWKSKFATLEKECERLQRELDELNSFRTNKEALEEEMAKLKQEMAEQQDRHSEEMDKFETKKAQAIEKKEQECKGEIIAARQMLIDQKRKQLDQTTKRTIMENEQMTAEKHIQNKETEKLIKKNDELKEQNAKLRMNVQIHKDLENELAKRTHEYQKLIKKMDQKAKAESSSRELRAGDSLDQEHTTMTDVHGSISRDLPSSLSRELPSLGSGGASAARMSEEVEKARKQLETAQATLAHVRHEFAHYKKDHSTLTQLQDQSTRLIISALYELRNQQQTDQFPPPSYDENADWQFAKMTPRQKEYFFRVLLERLNSSMCGCCFPTGPSSNHGGSSSSLPPIHTASFQQSEGPQQFSQFLLSMASQGGEPGGAGSLQSARRRDVAVKSVQTETVHSDPCLKEGLWKPDAKKKFQDSPITPRLVSGPVRNWGNRAVSQRTKGFSPRVLH